VSLALTGACLVEGGADDGANDTEVDTSETDTTETGAETGGEDLCAAASDEDPGPGSFTVHVQNSRATPIWLPGGDCLQFSRFELEVDGVVGKDLPDEGEACDLILQTQVCGTFGCEGDEIEGGAVRIGPGASFDFNLDPYFYPLVEFPGSCHEGADCAEPVSCRAGRAIPLNTPVVIRTTAHASCEDDLQGELCECEGGETCLLDQGSFGFGEALDGEISVASVFDQDEFTIEFD